MNLMNIIRGPTFPGDADTSWSDIGTLADKSPETVLEIHKEKYPGTVDGGLAPQEVWCDNRGELKGMYQKHVIDSGGRFLRSIKGRPKTNAKTKRFHQTFGGCVRACLAQASGPLRMWAACARHTMVNLTRVPDGNEDGESPFL